MTHRAPAVTLRSALLSILLLAAPTSLALAADPAPKPNIIFILADDLGIGNVSCYGADHFQTPNVDKLAAQGTRFTHCYGAPLCGPSRALIMTGRYAFRTGMTSNDTGPSLKPANEVMTPAVLKKAGYVTGQTGKWGQLPLQPGDWGFDEYLRFQGSGTYWNTQARGRAYTLNGKSVALKDGQYLPDLMHEFVVDFVNRHKDEPFYFYYSMSHVHTEILKTPDSKPGTTDFYADNVAYMDKLVGKLMDKLDELKLRDKTLVLFVGDNGTAPMFYDRATVQGRLLSGHKGDMLEGGSIVPMVANWPGHVPAGKTSDSLVDFTDYLPTFAELAGAPLPTGVTVDGHSFAAEILGQTPHPREWIFVELGRHWYARSLAHKLDEAGNLYDVSKAPFEEPVIPTSSTDPTAAASRKQLQAVLDKLSPASGKQDEGDGSGKHSGERRNRPKAAPGPAGAAGNRAEVWDSLDTDKAGKLTKAQFVERRKDLPNPARRFDAMDADHDGALTKDEFLAAAAAPAK